MEKGLSFRLQMCLQRVLSCIKDCVHFNFDDLLLRLLPLLLIENAPFLPSQTAHSVAFLSFLCLIASSFPPICFQSHKAPTHLLSLFIGFNACAICCFCLFFPSQFYKIQGLIEIVRPPSSTWLSSQVFRMKLIWLEEFYSLWGCRYFYLFLIVCYARKRAKNWSQLCPLTLNGIFPRVISICLTKYFLLCMEEEVVVVLIPPLEGSEGGVEKTETWIKSFPLRQCRVQNLLLGWALKGLKMWKISPGWARLAFCKFVWFLGNATSFMGIGQSDSWKVRFLLFLPLYWLILFLPVSPKLLHFSSKVDTRMVHPSEVSSFTSHNWS